jgi:acyl-CoA dehydrogenase
MNFEPSEEQATALEAWRGFIDRDMKPITDIYREQPIPRDVAGTLLKMSIPFGVGAGWFPEEIGGTGLDQVTSGLLYEELSVVSPDYAGLAFINEGAALVIEKLGTPELKQRYVAPMLKGDLVGCSAITEPGTGSNVNGLKFRAIRDGDGYRLSGEKTWISNGDIADIAMVVARSTEANGDEGISMFLVDRAEHGFESRNLEKLGLNGWPTSQIFFDDVYVPASHMLGKPGGGLRETLKLFERARCYVGLISVGIARAAMNAAVAYATERDQWGKKIAGHQMIQDMIANMATELECARLLCYQGLSLVDKGVRCDTQTSMAKFYATEAAVRIASNAVQIHGAMGLSRELAVEGHFRNARMMTIPDGTSQIQKLIIARNILGVSAFD